MSSDTKREPAFWRVVRERDGVREYLLGVTAAGEGRWTDYAGDSNTWRLNPGKRCGGHPVAVYHSVRKVKRGHDFGWAFRQVKAGKTVQCEESTLVFRSLDFLIGNMRGDLLRSQTWELAE